MSVRTIFLAGLGFCFAGLACAQSHFYDSADRLVRTTYTDGTTAVYTYDQASNLLEVTSADAPAAPVNFSATLEDETTATLIWEDTSDSETGFRIERRLAGTYDWQFIADLPPNSTQYIDPTLDPNETYVYRVYALGTDGLTSAYSREAAAAGADSAVFTIRTFEKSGERLEIGFDASATSTYRLETSTTLEPDSWTAINFSLTPSGAASETQVSETAGNAVIYFDVPTSVQNFYRLVRE